MVDVSQRCMKTNVLGNEVSMPIGIAPTAMQRMAHPDGECATAKAAEGRFDSKIILVAFNYYIDVSIFYPKYYSLILRFSEAGTIFILSTISTSSIEEIAEAAPTGIKWFQLYIYNDIEVMIYRGSSIGQPAITLIE